MRLDSATKQKKGLHFILASVIIWTAMLAALIVGVNFPPYVVAGMMIGFELLFSALLVAEVRGLPAAADIG